MNYIKINNKTGEKIASIAKEKGKLIFGHDSSESKIVNGKIEFIPEVNWDDLILWIFGLKPKEPTKHEITVEWIEEWYNLIIPELTSNDTINIFVLGGFMELLFDWFEKNNYKFNNFYGEITQMYQISILTPNNGEYHLSANTKQQSLHRTILETFTLMKNEKTQI